MATYKQKLDAFTAWDNSKCSDEQLNLALACIAETIESLQAMKVGSLMLVGLVLQQQSMESAKQSRRHFSRSMRNAAP